MECNKYEAIRAKEVAETKMQKNDFFGARKLAHKAQQIYPDTDNITQLITVCDVHCACQKKIDAYEMDWYGILQIAQTADDSAIKKHYRKLALLLHPDKNKFPGAEAAFKLIGEAHRLLSDPVKRRAHDMKRKTYVKPPVPYTQSNSQCAPKQSFQGGFKGPMSQYASVNLRQQHQPPAQPALSVVTFATVCPSCTKLQHPNISNKRKPVLCLSCKKSFIAMEAKTSIFTNEKNDKKAAFVKKDIPGQEQPADAAKFKENVHLKDIHINGSTKATGSKGVMKSSIDTKAKKINNRKRKKLEADSDSESESDTDEDEIFVIDDELANIPNTGTDGLRNPRRSTRHKHKVSYDESRNDDDDDDDDDELLSHDVAAKVGSTSENKNAGAEVNGSEYKTDHSDSASKESPNNCNTSQKLKNESPSERGNEGCPYSCPDPEFNNFDDLRKEECFKVGQIWALYDDDGAMPRFYGRIKAVYKPTKELRLTWLERVSGDDMYQKSADRLFPCSCGNYSRDKTQTIAMDDRSFSHPVVWKKGSGKKTYCIYPRQGQIWALNKYWNWNQASESTSTTTYEYEYVEVVSDYVVGRGVTVAYLGKAKGYGSIFCRMGNNGKTRSIPQDEIARFSHMIPSFQLIGEERGVFELDPASVPIDEKAIVDLEDLKILHGNFKPSFEGINDIDNYSGDESDDSNSAGSKSEGIKVPDSEFVNFHSSRYEDKFKAGQIWAVYWKDGLPTRYVLIQSVNSSPETKLVTKWLTLGGKQGDMIKWNDKEMPAGCGIFKLGRKKPEEFPFGTFSHIVNPQQTGNKDEFAIFPAKGEVWALYKDWKCEMNSEDIEDFEYEIAEVLYMDGAGAEVLPLQQDSKHKTVFRRQPNREVLRIPKAQLLRFSHQILAFQLTDESDGTLRGCWELDPAAIPPKLLFPS